MSITAQQMVTDAGRIVQALTKAGESLNTSENNEALRFLNGLFDSYSVMRSRVYSVSDNIFNLTANTQFYFIGAGATPTTIGGVPYGAINTPRPNQLLRANIIYQTSPQIARLPVEIIDYNTWLSLRVPDIFAIPLKLYYDYNYSQTTVGGATGLGLLSFWPGPQASYQVELASTNPLSDGAVLLTDTLLFPPGYQRALTFALAFEIGNLYEDMTPQAMARLERICDESIRTLEMLNAVDSDSQIDPALAGRGNDEFNWLVSLG
jgi:hypothetical protein